MKSLHGLLKRQIERYVSDLDALPDGWQRLLAAVDEAYRQFDADRMMLERSLELSSQELLQANQELARERLKESRESAERLKFALEAAHMGIWDWNTLTGELRWSDNLEQMHGLEPGSFAGTYDAFLATLHDSDRPFIAEAVVRTLEKGLDYAIQYRIVWPDGTIRWMEGKGRAFRDPVGRPVRMTGVTVDITESKNLEEQLRQSQKMEAVGQLAGGIAHDFNNLLTVIQGYSSFLLAPEILQEEVVDSGQQIIGATKRAADLISRLLTFSRKQRMESRDIDLNEAVGEMTVLLRRVVGAQISLKVEYSNSPTSVRADAGMLEQVFLNLAVNARDAMPQGGELTISTSVVKVTPGHVRRNPEASLGQFVCLSVRDSGCGIPPEHIPHIFEPFFTTKGVGEGTGLGLATVYGIVKQHYGWIEVATEVNKGTTFQVFLPFARHGAETASVEADGRRGDRGGKETILVAEDEPAVRAMVLKILKRHGYRVLEASSGVRALEIWEQHKEGIHLLLTDIVMPDGITGKELAERLTGEHPQLKVIFTSGYSADAVGKDLVLHPGSNFLQKPYSPPDLAEIVRNRLDRV